MPTALLNHVWQSTLFAVPAWLLTLALRNGRASVRYWLWFAASCKFLIPFSALVAIGSHFEWRTASTVVQPQFFSVVEEISQPVTPPLTRSANVPPAPRRGPAVLLGVWLCGVAIVIFAWTRQWSRARTALRAASPLPLNLPIRAMSSPARLEPGVFGLFRPVLLLPDGITQRLTPSQFEAILAHELSHVRRRDNLTAAIHMAVETIFWFHPLLWWIGKRMVDERERACDEAVLLAADDPQDYAEGILNVCKLYVESPLECVAGVTGSNLKKRIRAIMTEPVAGDLNFAKKLALAVAGVAALALPIVVGILNAPPLRAQSPPVVTPAPVKPSPTPQIVAQQSAAPRVIAQTAADPTPKFEVASIRPCAPAPAGTGGRGGTGSPSPGRLSVRCDTVANLIRQAYAMYPDGLSLRANFLYVSIEGGPAWIKSDRYDINAEAEGNASRELMNGPMLQALLEDRFKLKIHTETREIPVYNLTVAKSGLKLKRREEGSCAPLPDPTTLQPGQKLDLSRTCGSVWFARKPPPGPWTADMHGMSVDEFSRTLGRATDRPIIDKTGIPGMFDFHLEFAPDQTTPAFLPGGALLGNTPTANPPPAASADDPEGPSILTAIQEQLGLKLEPAKGPGEFLVIDSLEKPSEN